MQTLLLDVSRPVWRGWRGQFPTGVDRACLAYIRQYQHEALAVVQRGGFTYVPGRSISRALFRLLLERPDDFRQRLIMLAAKALLPHHHISRKTLKNALYLNVGHTGLNWPGHRRWVGRSRVRAVYYVHDLIPLTHPHFVREAEPAKHQERMETVLRCGKAVIANSEDSLNALRQFAAERALLMPPGLCAPLGLEEHLLRRGDIGVPPLDQPYFMIVGTIEGRKNHALLLRIWHDIAAQMGARTPRLVIIGQRGWSAATVFDMLDKDEALRPYVMELGRCGDDELRCWLAHARALLFPSFVEGQGLPLVEALAAGTPVIANNLAVFRETAGDVPDYIDAGREDLWQQAIVDYSAQESPRRAAQLARLPAFRPPTWDAHFSAVNHWLGQL